jgi:hypothetical protein
MGSQLDPRFDAQPTGRAGGGTVGAFPSPGPGGRQCAVSVCALCGRWTGLYVDDDQLGVDCGDVGVIRGKDSVASVGCGQGHVHVDNVRV